MCDRRLHCRPGVGKIQTFVRESSEQLQGVTATWGERHRLAVEGPPRPNRGADACDPGELEAALHLSESKAGQVIISLATSMREARACVVLAPELYQPLALFGEVQSPQADESAVQTSLLTELAELLPTLERVQVLLDRVATLAEHLMRQLAAIFDGVERRKDTSARTLRKSSFRPVLDMLGKLLRVPVIVDGLMLENTQFRQAYKSYSWVVSKASARQERVGMLELPPESAAALVEWLQTMESLALGDTFKLTLNRISEGLQGAGIDLSGSAFRVQLVAYFRTRMDESEASGSAAMDQLELPEECLVPWVRTFVLYGTVWKLGRKGARCLSCSMHQRNATAITATPTMARRRQERVSQSRATRAVDCQAPSRWTPVVTCFFDARANQQRAHCQPSPTLGALRAKSCTARWYNWLPKRSQRGLQGSKRHCTPCCVWSERPCASHRRVKTPPPAGHRSLSQGAFVDGREYFYGGMLRTSVTWLHHHGTTSTSVFTASGVCMLVNLRSSDFGDGDVGCLVSASKSSHVWAKRLACW